MNFFRKDPTINSIPRPTPYVAKSEVAAAFLDEHDQIRQDLAFYKDECQRLSNGMKVATEHIRFLKEELSRVQADKDGLSFYKATMLSGVDHLADVVETLRRKAWEAEEANKTREQEPQVDHPDSQSRLAAVEAALQSPQLEEPQQ